MRKLDFCLQPIEEFQSPNLTGTDAVSVAFEFNAALSHVWKNVSLVVGSLSNSDLGLEHSSLVNVSFTMSHLESQKQLCLTFYHPPSLIMPKTVPGCDPLKYNLAPKSAGAFVIPRIDRLPSAARFPNCLEKQKFNVGLQENPSWNVMLNQVTTLLNWNYCKSNLDFFFQNRMIGHWSAFIYWSPVSFYCLFLWPLSVSPLSVEMESEANRPKWTSRTCAKRTRNPWTPDLA